MSVKLGLVQSVKREGVDYSKVAQMRPIKLGHMSSNLVTLW